MSSFSTATMWNNLNKNLEVCAKAISRDKTPYEIIPSLRLKLISRLSNCLQQWQIIESSIHPFVSAETRWGFDCVGNILRSSIMDYQYSKLGSSDREKLFKQLSYAKEIGLNLQFEILLSSDRSFRVAYTSSEHITKQKGTFHIARNAKGRKDMYKKEASTLFDILKIHRENAADYRKLLAKDPRDISSRRQLEDETNSIGKIKKQLGAIGVRVNGSPFDNFPSEKSVMSFADHSKPKVSDEDKGQKPKQAISTKSENENKQINSKNRVEKKMSAEIKPYSKDDIASMRQSFVDYSAVFKNRIDLNLNHALKKAVETRFEVLLLRVNNLVREIEQNGDDAGYFLDISNLLYMSVKDLHSSDTSSLELGISNYLSAAVDIFDIALQE